MILLPGGAKPHFQGIFSYEAEAFAIRRAWEVSRAADSNVMLPRNTCYLPRINQGNRMQALQGGPLVAAICFLGGSLASFNAMGQTTTAAATSSGGMEEIVVTGSHIRRTDTETPSPMEVITAEEMHQTGYTSVQDVLHNLTANGQGTLSQGFSGAFASGAAGIALRGLNVGSTLVLIDGHRMAPYPIGDDGQRSFVDVSNIPFDAIERIEVLKDGASAVYGSDAIAGVVNIILKKSYQGASVTADSGLSSHGDGSQFHVSGIWGMGDLINDGHNFYVSAEYRKQNEIKFTDRGGIYTQTDFTSTGGYNVTPGVQNPIVGALPRSGTGYVTDSNGNIAGFMPGCNATTFAANQCTYHDTWDQIQPPTENINLVTRFTQNLADNWQASFQATYFEGKSQQVNGPDRAFAGGYQGVTSGPGVTPTVLPFIPQTTISNTNPTFPAGTGLTVGDLRYTFLNLGNGTITETDSKAYRAIADVNGKVAGWDLEFSAGFTEVALSLDGLNYVNPANLQTALDSTTAPFLVGQPNSAAVVNFVAPVLHTYDTSKLSFGHAGASRSIVDLPGGPLGIAFGADYYQRNQYAVAPPDVANGLTPNFSNNFTVGIQQVASGYFELNAPIVKQLDIDAAVRYDHYNLSGGRASPKIGFKFTPIPEFAIRGTASLGFRAPGPAENGKSGQTFFAGTTADPILCANPANPTAAGNFVGQCSVSIPGLQSTNPALKPETSKSFTLGFIFEPIRDISATIDLYSIEIDHQIVSGGESVTVRGDNLTPIPEYQANGTTALVAPPVAPILYTTTSYINANTTKTDGADFGLEYRHGFGIVDLRSKATWSFTRRYDLTIDGVTYHLAGTHGPFFYTGDTGNPKSRVQWANTVGHGPWEVTGTVNYISSFKVTDPSAIAFTGQPQDTCLQALTNAGGAASIDYQGVLAAGTIPSATSCTVKHFTTFDLYGRWDVTNKLNVHASVLNVFNAQAPLDWATYGGALGAVPWNPSLHSQGAIGAFFTLGATYKFY
jgi:iron complex outermembrane receptor protein